MTQEYIPDKRLVELFDTLEKKVETLLAQFRQLQNENKRLREQLAELERLREEAVNELNTIIDRIEMLL